MTQETKRIGYNKLSRIAEIFSGLAHPIRLEILELLEDGNSMSVGEILKEIKIEPTLLTHHLSKMKYLGILESSKEGRNVYYRLAILEISNIFDCIQNCRVRM
ncbi:MAG: metalloregulator ArsR/SmtB family transcription factor [Cyclobacteriaceae bacterium]|nr:metalloregulator ArsR/SmtB family transcription factor [Cyclobacteriaceae bacterium]